MFRVLVDGCIPKKGSKHSAAIDLYASEDISIQSGENEKVGLGVCIEKDKLYGVAFANSPDSDYEYTNETIENFMKSHYLQLEPRSSLRAKGLQAETGIIDLDYKDEIRIIIHNPITFMSIIKWLFSFGRNKSVFKISKGDKIAQILLKEHKTYLMGIESEEERTGGFGSTGN